MISHRTIVICGVVLVAAFTVFEGCKKDSSETDSPPVQENRSEKLEEKISFAAGDRLTAGGEVIDVEVGHLVPCAVDWNNDGKKDLVVGQFSAGSIRLYLNDGTDSEPAFNEFSLLEAGGKPIRLDAG